VIDPVVTEPVMTEPMAAQKASVDTTTKSNKGGVRGLERANAVASANGAHGRANAAAKQSRPGTETPTNPVVIDPVVTEPVMTEPMTAQVSKS
jgi:hypothetical protein